MKLKSFKGEILDLLPGDRIKTFHGEAIFLGESNSDTFPYLIKFPHQEMPCTSQYIIEKVSTSNV